MIKHSLAAFWLKLRRPVFHQISPILIVILVVVVADGGLWYISFDSAGQTQSALTQLAVGLAVAVITLALGWAITARSEAKSLGNTRKTAYKEFVSLSDRLVAARSELTIAESARNGALDAHVAASEQASRNQDEINANAKLVAFAELTMAQRAFSSASAADQEISEAYWAAEKTVAQVAARSVRPAFEEFRKFSPEDTAARASARSSFTQAANIDLEFSVG